MSGMKEPQKIPEVLLDFSVALADSSELICDCKVSMELDQRVVTFASCVLFSNSVLSGE